MLAESKLKHLIELTQTFTKEEIIWANGYLSGLVSHNPVTASNTTEKATAVKKISLVFGTETGNSKKLATDLAVAAKKKGIIVNLTSLDQYRLSNLEREEYFFVIVSTHGEGEPPASAQKFFDHIHQGNIALPKLKYSVLALGDTTYPLFCKTGEDIDSRLNVLGAQRIVALQKCDLDFDADAAQWFEKVINAVQAQGNALPAVTAAPITKQGKKYYPGKIITSINLNDHGSDKQTFHLEIAVDEKVIYEPGDSLAITPVNKKIIVEKIISITGIDRQMEIATAKVKASVNELLARHLNICYLLSSTIKKYAAITGHDIPAVRMDLIDLLHIYPVKDAAQFAEVIGILTSIAPRLYSISSSPLVHDDIHLTISKTAFMVEDEQRYGLCSDFIGDQPEGSSISFYIHPNRAFKLPSVEKDIIMIGPGTGIAPFRSFIAERDAISATGKNWLFFGEQNFTTDFLYQSEVQQYYQTNALHKISLAFEKEQQQESYVQHRIIEQGKEFFEWLESGAYLYISGHKTPMSVEVEKACLLVIEEFGKKTSGEATQYLETLKKEGRYQKDVY
jgi:sulfite reductase (NADPH) flavoprotein alpha-component